jgi:hypothetical protein
MLGSGADSSALTAHDRGGSASSREAAAAIDVGPRGDRARSLYHFVPVAGSPRSPGPSRDQLRLRVTTMRDRSPIRRFMDNRAEVAAYHPHALQKVIVSHDVLRDWRALDASIWKAEGWGEVPELAVPCASDDEFRRVLETILPVTEIRVVELPTDYLEVTPV